MKYYSGAKINKNEVDGGGVLAGTGGMHMDLVGKLEGKRPLANPGVDERIIRKWIFTNRDGAWTGLIWLRLETGGGLL